MIGRCHRHRAPTQSARISFQSHDSSPEIVRILGSPRMRADYHHPFHEDAKPGVLSLQLPTRSLNSSAQLSTSLFQKSSQTQSG